MTTRPHRPAIFITGAAAGIGRATARRFAREGWAVGLTDVDTDALDTVARELGDAACYVGPLDVRLAGAWREALQGFWDACGGRLDLLFNNAGIAVTAPFEEADVARHGLLLDVNVRGIVNGCHAAHAYLKRTPGSRVVNMCSASALHGQPMLSTTRPPRPRCAASPRRWISSGAARASASSTCCRCSSIPRWSAAK